MLLFEKILPNYLAKEKPLNRALFMYGLPCLFSLSATFVKIIIFPNTGYVILFLLYFGAILLSGCLGGFRSAFISTLAVIISASLILPYFDTLTHFNFLEFILFIIESTLVVSMFFIIEKALNKITYSEKRFRRIIDQSAEGFIICNRNGFITYSSPSFQKILNIEQGERCRSLEDVIHPEDKPLFINLVEKLKQDENGSAMLRQRLKTSSNEWVWTECCVNNLLNDELVHSFIIQLRNINVKVNQENRQEDFIHMASHELKSPITAIKGFLQLSGKKFKNENGEEFQYYVSRMEGQIEKLVNLIDNMLNLTKIKMGEIQYHFELRDVRECINEAVQAMQVSVSTHTITTELPPYPLPSNIDPTRIGQVISNLLNNAVKYSPDHNLIHVNAEKKGEQIKVAIKDHGIGIPKDQLQRIFDRFYRVDTLPKGKFNGLGLGLFISNEIIKAHHGCLTVESKENEGSSFHFTLPLEN